METIRPTADSVEQVIAPAAIECGLIAAGIALAIIAAVPGVGTKLSTNFNSISTSLK